MDEATDRLVCRFCGKPAKSRSGLTNHEKTCKKAPKDHEEVDVSEVNPYDRNPQSEDNSQDQECSRRDRPKQKSGQFGIGLGAFFIMADHIPMVLDIDFCSALSAHILEHGSPNSAIMAFAHQLNKATGD
ncbi:MAG: hypothetical protein WC919_01445 [Candidatus Paceibacterota bacterium]|jgi:hypothetical protein